MYLWTNNKENKSNHMQNVLDYLYKYNESNLAMSYK